MINDWPRRWIDSNKLVINELCKVLELLRREKVEKLPSESLDILLFLNDAHLSFSSSYRDVRKEEKLRESCAVSSLAWWSLINMGCDA